jgi:hypothetical protein
VTRTFYEGSRFVVTAHYPKLTDQKTEGFATREKAIAAKNRHCAAGANVQIERYYWREVCESDGWFTARAHAATPGRQG